MGLSDVPVEVLLCIADQFEYYWQVNALGQTCRGFHATLNSYLYLFNKKGSRSSLLCDGAREGYNTLVERLLKVLISTNALDEFVWTEAMVTGVRNGRPRIIELLIQAAEDVPRLSQWCITLDCMSPSLFWCAAAEANEPIVRLLLERGMVPFSTPEWCSYIVAAFSEQPSMIMTIIETAPWLKMPGSPWLTEFFHHALKHPSSGTPDIINRLIEKGVNVSLPIGNGESSLCLAIRQLNPGGAHCLLENGVSPELADGTYLTPLALAVRTEQTETAKILMEKVNFGHIVAQGREVGTLFCAAAACGLERMVDELLQSGCHPDTTMEHTPGWPVSAVENPALVWASKHQQEETARLLLKHGAKADSRALAPAVQSGNLAIVEMLLDAGIDPNGRDEYRPDTPVLTTAARHEAVFRLFLERGASIPEGEEGTRLLMVPIQNGQIPLVQMLLDRGMSLNGHGYCILSAAVSGGAAMREFVASHGYQHQQAPADEYIDIPWYLDLGHPDFTTFKWLMDKGFYDELTDYDLWTMIADIFCNFEVHEAEQALDLLLSRGADINMKGGHLIPYPIVWTATLHLDDAIMKAFLDRGAIPILRTGASPEDVPQSYASHKPLDLLLKWVVDKYPRSQAKTVLSSMKERAKQGEHWGDLRRIYQFEDRNGFD